MKPLQFYQQKWIGDRQEMLASKSTTLLASQLAERQRIHPVSAKNITKWATKKTIATLLFEYYSILFDPQYRNYFRPMKDLSLLFPTKEVISISPETNFILLPLPLPTYEQWTLQWKYYDNCPFLKPWIPTNEFVRDLDYSIDSRRYQVAIKERVVWKKDAINYPHTNALQKIEWTNNPLIKEARIWTYRYKDFPKYVAETIDTYPIYSFSSSFDESNLIIQNWRRKASMNKDKFNKSFTYNKFVFLEIPNQTNPNLVKKYYHLNEYSKQMLIPNLLDEKFPTYFDFKQVPQEAIIRYFMKNAIPMNEYSPIQIRTGIKRLKDIIKFAKPIQTNLSTTPDQDHLIQEQDHLIQEPNKKWRPSREYLDTHWAKRYKPDGSVVEFETYDTQSLYRKTKEELTNLYSNQSMTWYQE